MVHSTINIELITKSISVLIIIIYCEKSSSKVSINSFIELKQIITTMKYSNLLDFKILYIY